MASPNAFQTAHSPVESTTWKTSSSPAFSGRNHIRHPSSASSMMSSPDSPVSTAKYTLDDLLEDPAERDDCAIDYSLLRDMNEPMCICDTTFCEHRQARFSERQPRPSFNMEWTWGDERLADDRLFGERSSKRRKSGDLAADGLASRFSRHFPSLSQRFTRHRPSASLSAASSRSVPHSRASSIRIASPSRSVIIPPSNDLYTHGVAAISPASSQESHASFGLSQAAASFSNARASTPVEDMPEEPQELVRTPLLPPVMAETYASSDVEMTSPLQLPSVAPLSSTAAAGNHHHHGIPTPPLSAKPSAASLAQPRPNHSLHPTSEIPSLAISEEADPWAMRLGHANFHITPEPYMPQVHDVQSCKRLLTDWESARLEYMRQAARVCEHYGQTSQIYKLTEEKWAGIDSEWRAYHTQANQLAEARGESPLFQALAETKPLAKIPSLTDPQQPSKFLAVDEADIVGPMVQYAKIQHQRRSSASKKSGLLRLFTDPSAFLSGRSASSSRP